ncbi:hypothetical protein [Hymenobacter busanensis]|uniref:hypothetical protein n=1 Tax=Hymenobacter busanensis TaxID=2607656 RepID=UPI001366E4A3|nr:hypothetical protein [Hymenobacter busanensis]QHJ06029.1 hypothetical protein GUY19_01455 [Hymenobacter busanensis]
MKNNLSTFDPFKAQNLNEQTTSLVMRCHFNQYVGMPSSLEDKTQPGFGAQPTT